VLLNAVNITEEALVRNLSPPPFPDLDAQKCFGLFIAERRPVVLAKNGSTEIGKTATHNTVCFIFLYIQVLVNRMYKFHTNATYLLF
jgi:hypothetical protein